MSRAEFDRWVEFYRRAPFDDYHRFHRPAGLIAHSNSSGGGEIAELLEWLRHDTTPKPGGALTEADIATMRAFGLKPPTRS